MSERPSLRDPGRDPADPLAAYLDDVAKRYRVFGESDAMPRLLAAVEAALKHHQPGKLPWCGTCGPQRQPCQEMADIRSALLGPETTSAEMEG